MIDYGPFVEYVYDPNLEAETPYDAMLAIILRKDLSINGEGIRFFTPDEWSQQLAFMRHPAGKEIEPHIHNPVPREVKYTQEVLIVRKGKLRVDFYRQTKEYLESHVLSAGDIILLVQGGHGFTMLEETEMFEVKVGPFAGDKADKTRFPRPEFRDKYCLNDVGDGSTVYDDRPRPGA